MTTTPLEALADRIIERMRGGDILAVSHKRSRTILVEELRKFAATVRPICTCNGWPNLDSRCPQHGVHCERSGDQ